jgi:hypothetical protein
VNPLILQTRVDSCDFLNEIEIVQGQVADPGKVLERLLAPALGEEPSRALTDPNRANEEKTSGNELDAERDEPLGVRWC